MRNLICPGCRQLKSPRNFKGRFRKPRKYCAACTDRKRPIKSSNPHTCPICGKRYKLRFERQATCGRPCSDILRAHKASARRASRDDSKLPERSDDAAYCPACRSPLCFRTDWLGRVSQFCRCDERLVQVKRPVGFHRYEATEQRLKWLAGAVESACQPVNMEQAEAARENGDVWRKVTHQYKRMKGTAT